MQQPPISTARAEVVVVVVVVGAAAAAAAAEEEATETVRDKDVFMRTRVQAAGNPFTHR